MSFDDEPDPLGRASLRGTPEQIADGLRALSAAGATHITCMLSPARQGIEQFAPVIAQFRRE